MRVTTSPIRSRAFAESVALLNRNSTSAASVTFTLSADSAVRTLSSSDVDSYERSTTGSSMSTTPGAAASSTATLASQGYTGERLHAWHYDVDRGDGVGRCRQRGLEVDGRILLHERG